MAILPALTWRGAVKASWDKDSLKTLAAVKNYTQGSLFQPISDFQLFAFDQSVLEHAH